MGLSKGKFKARAVGGGVGHGVAVAAGAAANTDIAVAGLSAVADVYAVVQYAGGVPSDVTANLTVVKAGAIQLSSVSTGDELVVYYEQPLSN